MREIIDSRYRRFDDSWLDLHTPHTNLTSLIHGLSVVANYTPQDSHARALYSYREALVELGGRVLAAILVTDRTIDNAEREDQ